MPFARHEDDVTCAREREGLGERLAAVRHVTRGLSGRLDARAHVAKDRLGLLRARVVGRHDDLVGEQRRDAAHLRALPLVAVAAASEHGDHAAASRRRDRPHRPEHALEGGGLVRVVHEDGESARVRHRFEAPGDARHGLEARRDLGGRKPERDAGGGSRQQVLGVRPAEKRGIYC